jgi:hypothetical protein
MAFEYISASCMGSPKIVVCAYVNNYLTRPKKSVLLMQAFYFIMKSLHTEGSELYSEYATTWVALFHMTLGEYEVFTTSSIGLLKCHHPHFFRPVVIISGKATALVCNLTAQVP